MQEILAKFKEQQVLVFGDLIADIYEFGLIRRLSREAPIPIVEYESEHLVPGGAGNVIANLNSLGGMAVPISVIGCDEPGSKLLEHFKMKGIDTKGIINTPSLFTTTKRRIMAQCEHTVRQQVFRMDRLPREALDALTKNEIRAVFQEYLSSAKAVIFSDYHLPVFPKDFIMELAGLARREQKKVIVDSRHRILEYQGVTLLTPNRSEAEEAVEFELRTISDLEKAGAIILEKTKAELLLITLGDEGMFLYQSGEKGEHIPVYNKQDVFDVSGAGDTVVAAISLGLLSGMSPLEAAKFANIAAGIVVRKLGTATVTVREILNELNELPIG